MQERIERFHFFRDARNCRLGDVLSRVEICRSTGLNNNQLEFLTNQYGKLLLIDNPHIHFNISHTGHYIVCAVCDKSLGIDIEFIKLVDIAVAKRFLRRMKQHTMNAELEKTLLQDMEKEREPNKVGR